MLWQGITKLQKELSPNSHVYSPSCAFIISLDISCIDAEIVSTYFGAIELLNVRTMQNLCAF